MIKNKNILITGGNSGIGFFAVKNLLKTKNNLYVVITVSYTHLTLPTNREV